MRRKEMMMMMMKMNMEKMNRNMMITLTRKEMVMKMEKMNMPPRPYKWRVLLPLLQGHCEVGDEASFCHDEHGLLDIPRHATQGSLHKRKVQFF